jgi:hypothetical protein
MFAAASLRFLYQRVDVVFSCGGRLNLFGILASLSDILVGFLSHFNRIPGY